MLRVSGPRVTSAAHARNSKPVPTVNNFVSIAKIRIYKYLLKKKTYRILDYSQEVVNLVNRAEVHELSEKGCGGNLVKNITKTAAKKKIFFFIIAFFEEG